MNKKQKIELSIFGIIGTINLFLPILLIETGRKHEDLSVYSFIEAIIKAIFYDSTHSIFNFSSIVIPLCIPLSIVAYCYPPIFVVLLNLIAWQKYKKIIIAIFTTLLCPIAWFVLTVCASFGTQKGGLFYPIADQYKYNHFGDILGGVLVLYAVIRSWVFVAKSGKSTSELSVGIKTESNPYDVNVSVPNSADKISRLKELEKIFQEKLMSEQEYKDKRKSIIDSL